MNDTVVITGLGILSPLGIGVEETAAALREGAPALFPATRCTPPAGVSPLCGEVPAFRIGEFVPSPKAYLDRNSELLLAACGMALRHAQIDPAKLVPERSGLLMGTAWAGQDSMAAFFTDYVRKGPRLVKPFLFPHTYFNTAISLVAIEWSLRGVHQSFAAGRVSAGHALIEARDLLLEDEADTILAGGCEALGPALFRGLAALGLLKPVNAGSAAGLVPAEAGVVLVLERRSRARARGAAVLGAITGAGIAAATANQREEPSPVVTAARLALAEAGIAPADLALVVTSANGTDAVDRAEADALRQVLAGAPVPVFAPASLCGDVQGACAALQVSLAALALAARIVPPATPLRPGPALVLTSDPAGSATALVVA